VTEKIRGVKKRRVAYQCWKKEEGPGTEDRAEAQMTNPELGGEHHKPKRERG
jgi:uncharacterized protein YeaO (DUF488 family)